ncbi:MAG: tail fiber domain-containing protein [Planctomycetes bacterium]|nr:tail fiber domain-containing protein [Planctomycetota bacterium]
MITLSKYVLRVSLLAAVWVGLLAAPPRAVAALPGNFVFQSRLTDASGNPSSGGGFDFVVALYDAATGGNKVFEESHTSLTLADGVVSLEVGAGSNQSFPQGGSSLFDVVKANDTLWLNLTVETEAMAPRLKVDCAPFAMRASVADRVSAEGGSATAPSLAFRSDADTGLFNAGANAVALATGGAERLRVDSSGRLGVGTIAPVQTLDVSGDVRVRGSSKLYFGGSGSESNLPSMAYSDAWRSLHTGMLMIDADNWSNPVALYAWSNKDSTISGPYFTLRLECSDTTDLAGNGPGIGFYIPYSGGTTAGGFIKVEKANATSSDYSANMLLGARANGSGLATALTITSQGKVGIGTSSPDEALRVIGTVKADDVIDLSDLRLKENVRDLSPVLDKVLSLKPRVFDMKPRQVAVPEMRDPLNPDLIIAPAQVKSIPGPANRIGFVAQELREVFPEVVSEGEMLEGGPLLGISLPRFPAILTKAIQEQQAQVVSLKSAVEQLAARVDTLERR